MALYTNARRRGQMLSNRRNVTGGPGVVGPPKPIPGQTPPIIVKPPVPPRPIPTGTNAQGYDPIHYGQNNQRIGYAKVGQARNQPGAVPPTGAPPPGGNMGHLAELLSQGILPDRFDAGFNISPTGKIVDTTVGVQSAAHNAMYQKLYNAAQQAGLNITGGSGAGGAYNPQVLYARGGNHEGFVDMRTGLINPPSTGAAENGGTVSPAVLARLQAQSGYTGEQAAATGNSNAVGMNASGTLSNWQLGSDGQYHDINTSLPPGVTLKPPQGATAPLTQPIGQQAETALGTPQAAINAGKDPTKHQAYWLDKGWVYNEATDQWTQSGGNAGGSAFQQSQAGASNAGGTTTPPQAGAAAATMPLDPAYIAAQRAAQYQLNSTLQGVDPALEQINAQNQLALARMQTNQGVDTQALMEALAARGALQSSIYGTERGNLATNYLRTGQDLAADVANAQSQVYQQEQGAYNDYYAALIEALLSSAATSSTSQYTPVGSTRKVKKKKRGKNRGGS